jgi:TolA-binding protein
MPQKSKGMDKKLTTMKHEIAQAASSPQRGLAQDGGDAPRRRGKKIILGLMVGASIVVVASWAVFTVKPSWFAEVKARLPFTGAPKNKRSAARHPSKPVFKVVQPQRTNPLPPATPPMMAEQMQRPQTSPSGLSPSAPPSAYPVTRPQVSTPGAPGIPPSVPPSLAKGPPPATYPGARPEVAMPNASGIAPTMQTPLAKGPPSAAAPFPGEVDRPPAGASSGQGATSGFSPSKKEDSESDEYLEIATLYAQKGKYQKAEELFQKVAKENPSSAKVHNNLGVVRLKQEKYDMAEREFKEAIRLEPAFVLPYYNLACLYSKKGVSVEALIYLKKALKRDERVKQWVKSDKDFDRLRSDVVFQELVGGSPAKKEGAKKTEITPKPERVQSQDSVAHKEGPLKKEEAQKQETPTAVGAPTTGVQKKEEIPPQAGPLQPVPPTQQEMQKQGAPPAGAPNQQGQQGSAPQGAQGAQGGMAK